MHESDISYLIRKAAFEMHTELGPGLLESVYEIALQFELQQVGLLVKAQVPLPMVYKGVGMDVGFRMDLLVENRVVVEIKSIEHHYGSTSHAATYLSQAIGSQTRPAHQF